MGQAIRSRIVRIGNSRGIRIPKILLEQAALGDEVDLLVQGSALVVRAARKRREGWSAAFARMAEQGDDRLVDQAVSTRWDEEEWVW